MIEKVAIEKDGKKKVVSKEVVNTFLGCGWKLVETHKEKMTTASVYRSSEYPRS